MITIYFNLKENIVVPAVLVNDKAFMTAKLIFDTGASRIMIPKRIAVSLHLLHSNNKMIEIATASKIERVPIVVIPRISIAGATLNNSEAIVKDLPPGANVDGLLGLNFIKHFNVNIDFKSGKLTLQ